jgi:hypothetical protein
MLDLILLKAKTKKKKYLCMFSTGEYAITNNTSDREVLRKHIEEGGEAAWLSNRINLEKFNYDIDTVEKKLN